MTLLYKPRRNEKFRSLIAQFPYYFVDSKNFTFWKQIVISGSKTVAITKHSILKDELFVVTEYNVDPNSPKNQFELFKKRVELLSKFQSPVILSMYGYGISEDEKIGYIYMPFSLGGNFQNYLSELDISKPKTNEIMILLGLSYAAMKLEEIGINPKIDFSRIRLNSSLKPVISFWEDSLNTNQDFYGFGTIMWQMCSKKPIPKKNENIVSSLKELSPIVNEGFKKLIRKCLENNDGLTWDLIYEYISYHNAAFKNQDNSELDSYYEELEAMMPEVDDYFNKEMNDDEIKSKIDDLSKTELDYIILEIWHKLMLKSELFKISPDNVQLKNLGKNIYKIILMKPEVIPRIKSLKFDRFKLDSFTFAILRAPDYIVSSSDFDINKEEILGSGAFGTVYKAYNKKTNKYYAYKRCRGITPDKVKWYLREIIFLASTNHPSLLHLTGFCLSPNWDKVDIITPFIDGGSLEKYLIQKDLTIEEIEQYNLTPTQKTTILMTVAYGLKILHEESRIIHRDIKPDNIMINKSHFPIIIDFGAAKLEDINIAEYDTHSSIGTPAYQAPEVRNGLEYSFPIDVFSYGRLLYAFLTREIPPIIIDESIYDDRSYPKSLRDLLSACNLEGPEGRPTFSTIYESFRNHEVSFPGTDEEEVNRIAELLENHAADISIDSGEMLTVSADMIGQFISATINDIINLNKAINALETATLEDDKVEGVQNKINQIISVAVNDENYCSIITALFSYINDHYPILKVGEKYLIDMAHSTIPKIQALSLKYCDKYLDEFTLETIGEEFPLEFLCNEAAKSKLAQSEILKAASTPSVDIIFSSTNWKTTPMKELPLLFKLNVIEKCLKNSTFIKKYITIPFIYETLSDIISSNDNKLAKNMGKSIKPAISFLHKHNKEELILLAEKLENEGFWQDYIGYVCRRNVLTNCFQELSNIFINISKVKPQQSMMHIFDNTELVFELNYSNALSLIRYADILLKEQCEFITSSPYNSQIMIDFADFIQQYSNAPTVGSGVTDLVPKIRSIVKPPEDKP